jgi:hypothetical protein
MGASASPQGLQGQGDKGASCPDAKLDAMGLGSACRRLGHRHVADRRVWQCGIGLFDWHITIICNHSGAKFSTHCALQ